MIIGSKCHESSVAVTEFYSINLPRTEVLTAYCLPRKFIGSNCHCDSQGNWAYQSATYGIPHRPIDCMNFPPNVVDCLLIIDYVTSWLPLAVWVFVAINWWQL